jgi:hypothetical protein
LFLLPMIFRLFNGTRKTSQVIQRWMKIIKILHAFNGNRRFIIFFTRPRHSSLSWARLISPNLPTLLC